MATEKQGKRAHKRFPLFIDLSGKPVTVIGGGKIAQRRIETLWRFGAQITVISPETDRLPEGIILQARPYRKGDLAGAFLAVAATNERVVNHLVALEAQEKGILISVADCKEECTFFFPAVCEGGKLVVGVVSDGSDHEKTARAAAEIRNILNRIDGEENG